MSDQPVTPYIARLIAAIIAAINTLNQPWMALLVIVIGAVFDVVCKRYGMTADGANQIMGAGIGLLTGQAIQAVNALKRATDAPGPIVVPPTPPPPPPPVVVPDPTKEN